VILAHIGGLPVEESVLGIAPTACVLAAFLRARVVGWLRRR
jgi:hypothetical protein